MAATAAASLRGILDAWPGSIDGVREALLVAFPPGEVDKDGFVLGARERTQLELSFRELVWDEMATEVTSEDCRLTRVLLMSATAAQLKLTTDNALSLLSDALDTQTTVACEHIFGFLERHAALFTAGLDPGKGKGLALLALVNTLVRRLSKRRQTAFSGRIRSFLANALPLTERSGVNANGSFNTDSMVTIDTEDAVAPSTEDGEIGEGSLYRTFWGLQAYFSDPRQCWDPAGLARFSEGLGQVLAYFASHATDEGLNAGAKVASQTAHPPSSPRKRARTEDGEAVSAADAKESLTEAFFPKFLSSASLFPLEVRSAPFRRQFLLQALLLLEHLLGCAPSKKALLAKAPNQLAVPKLTLTEKAEAELTALRDETRRIMQETPPDGAAFLELVDELFRRESRWVKWKLDNCKPFERAAPENFSLPLGSFRRPKLDPTQVNMSSAELNRLWNLHPDTDAFLRDESEAMQVPTAASFLDALVQQLDPANGIEKEYLYSRDPVFVWRAVRLASQEMLDKLPVGAADALECSDGVKLPNIELTVARVSEAMQKKETAETEQSVAVEQQEEQGEEKAKEEEQQDDGHQQQVDGDQPQKDDKAMEVEGENAEATVETSAEANADVEMDAPAQEAEVVSEETLEDDTQGDQ